MSKRSKHSGGATGVTSVALRDLSFSHPGADVPLFTNLNIHLPRGFTGVIGGNGSGKTTLLRLLLGELIPDEGVVERVPDVWYCPQRTDAAPPELDMFLQDWSATACEIRGRLRVDADWADRWHSLSHGERKRAQIAQALSRAPDLLLLDEPTNHIDADARTLLIETLGRFTGIGVLVSHDRELLDALVDQCVWLQPPEATTTPGGYSKNRELRATADASAARTREKLRREVQRLQREEHRRREHAANEHRRRSKRGLAQKDHDAKEKIDRARNTDGGAAAPLQSAATQSARAQARLADHRTTKTYDADIWVSGRVSQRNSLLRIDAGALTLADGRRLTWPDLTIGTTDRIALVGPNGAGKSTLLGEWLGALNVPEERVLYLPQEISASAARALLAEVQQRSNAELGRAMSIVSRLGSRPQRLLASQQPSPGEVRKLLLAMGISNAPEVLVLDEPTNHLDLPSIEALERALADCPCAMLFVSHDRAFIEALGATPWLLRTDGDGVTRLMTG